MPFVYIVAESETDMLFYIASAENITGSTLDYEPIISRKRSGINAARRMLRHMLTAARNAAGGGEGVFWIAAMDNDRAPQHPDGERPPGNLSKSDRSKANRYDELHNAAYGSGEEIIPGAIAVPVEMLESWVLQALSPDETLDLPYFAEQDSSSARAYYGSEPPPQLKDLARDALKDHGADSWHDFLIDVAAELDSDILAGHSRSFALFRDAIADWDVS